MQTASDNFTDRLLPITAEDFYSIRHRLSAIANLLQGASHGGPMSCTDMEDMWLEMVTCVAVLDRAWAGRRPNLRVVK